MVQRYYSTRSEKDARKVGYFVCALLFIGPPVFYLPAMAARLFLPALDNGQMNQVYALICKSVLPAGFMGLVIAAMFSATMSTLAGDYNAAASVLTNDFYKRMVAPNATPRQQMLAARVATVLVGSLVIGLTFVMQTAQGANDLFDVTNKMFGVFLPPVAIPMMLGLVTRRISRRGGVLGLLGGIAAGLGIFVAGSRWPELREMGTIFLTTCAATAAGLLGGTWLFPDDRAHDETLNAFFERVGKPGPVLQGPAARITFWPLVAGGLAFIGSVLILACVLTRPFAEVRVSVWGGAAMLAVAGAFAWLSKRQGPPA
jgi:Na+/proline symporter